MAEQTSGNLRVLKGIVIGLGVLIALAFAGVVWGIIRKSHQLPPAAAMMPVPLPPANWTGKSPLPDGAQVVGATAAEGRLIVTLKTPGGSEIRLFDLASGQPAGVLTLSP